MERVKQTKESRDAIREGRLLPELYELIERAYRRHGLPGVAIAMHNREVALMTEMDALEEKVDQTVSITRILVGLRIEQDGHAKNLGEAIKFASDPEKVAGLYPELAAWAYSDKGAH